MPGNGNSGNGNVVKFPRGRRHARASAAAGVSRKSFADTSPPVTVVSLATSSQDGRFAPRLIRLIVDRSDPTIRASASSSSPAADIQSVSFMTPDSAYDARACQAQCASDAVDHSEESWCDPVAMAPVPKPRPRHATFLRAWRKHKGLTQEKAADRIGCDRTLLGRIENGKVPYNQMFLEAAADAYECEPADLLMRDPKSPIWTVMDTIRQLSPADQERVVKIVETFRDAA
jgi:transcriptional regulator with XRE-family HTH domain